MASMQVQSLIFDKEKFSRAEAIKWAKDHDFVASGVDETGESYRIRQEEPGKFRTMRTISMTEGVKAVVGKGDEIKKTSPETIAKMLYPGQDPVAVRAQILEDNDGFIGGTIRYAGSSSGGSEFGTEYTDEGVRRNVDGPSERFSFGDLTFDVDSAKELCDGEPNDEIEVSDVWSVKINVDKVAAMRSTSRNPVLVAQIPTSKGLVPLLIDGHHRMYRAAQEGIELLPAYVLSPEETLFIIDTHPDMMTTLTKNLRDIVDRPTVKSDSSNDKIGKIWATIISKAQPGSDVHVPTAGSDDEKPKPAVNQDQGAEESPGGQITDSTANTGVGIDDPDFSRLVPKYREKARKKAQKLVEKWMDSLVDKDAIQKGVLEAMDLVGAREAVRTQDEYDIEFQSAVKWTALACAVFELAANEADLMSRCELVDWGDDLYHEALEHAGLMKDHGKTVAEVQSIIEGYKARIPLVLKESDGVQIRKADHRKQIVYGVVLEPDTEDAQGDVISAEDIEEAAHGYLERARKVKARHKGDPIEKAFPVESYIAPCDLKFDGGPYGSSVVKKGSWVLGVKVLDPEEWAKVEKGEYKAFSVGGTGTRV